MMKTSESESIIFSYRQSRLLRMRGDINSIFTFSEKCYGHLSNALLVYCRLCLCVCKHSCIISATVWVSRGAVPPVGNTDGELLLQDPSLGTNLSGILPTFYFLQCMLPFHNQCASNFFFFRTLNLVQCHPMENLMRVEMYEASV